MQNTPIRFFKRYPANVDSLLEAAGRSRVKIDSGNFDFLPPPGSFNHARFGNFFGARNPFHLLFNWAIVLSIFKAAIAASRPLFLLLLPALFLACAKLYTGITSKIIGILYLSATSIQPRALSLATISK